MMTTPRTLFLVLLHVAVVATGTTDAVADDPAEAIINVGMTRAGLAQAAAIYERVKAPDARVEYAYGLALLKNFRRAEAIEHLVRCRGQESCLPGWEAALRVLADERRYEEILNDLPVFAKAVSSAANAVHAVSDGESSNDAAIHDDVAGLAYRLGQLIAAVELASQNEAKEEKTGEAAWLATLANLTPPLQSQFDRGYLAVESLASEIASRKQTRRDLRDQRAEAKVAEDRLRLQATIKQAEKTRGDLSKSAVAWDAQLAKEQQAASDKLAAFAAEVDQINRRQQARLVVLAQLRAAATQLEASIQSSNISGDIRRLRLQQLQADIAARLLDIEDAEFYRADVLRDAQIVQQQYAAIVNRAKAVLGDAANRYESLTKAGQAAEKRLKKLQSDAEKLAKEQNDANQNGDGEGGWTPTFSVRELVPWDFEAEAARL